LPCGLIPGLFVFLRYLISNSCDVFSSHLRFPISFTSRSIVTLPFLSHDELLEKVDERLIKRGMLIMDLNFLRNYRDELIRMNRKKRGRSYRIAEIYVMFLAVIRYLIIQIP
jgi:hypothetical protein